ncbi:MAG: sigma-54-dependent Fis family transcriptional regulator [Alphaproteobacteria bacterium]|nr:sigma-54-dependent Fis family transcriptional regulator [Alphaproteobacteria bacterium]
MPEAAAGADPAGLPAVLVVDDEDSLRHLLRVILQRLGYPVREAGDGRAALEELERSPEVRVVLCDVRMPRMGGLDFLREVRGRDVFVVMMSAYASTDLAVEALRAGAYDFISKPFRADEIRACLQRIVDREELAQENRRLRAQVRQQEDLEGFIGQSEAAREVMALVTRVAAYPSTVLLTGESGTGKELLAGALHKRSTRASGPMVAVNCAAIPENLLESELFGHERGAFTGAVRAHRGLFEQADGGTLLLDEIGDMPIALQSKLLRVLEDGRIRRVGARGDQPVDVRVVAATAIDLERAVAEGRFRKDLFYRLNVVHVRIPPLRERVEDIPLLAERLVERAAVRLGREDLSGLSVEARRVLVGCPWPGNVRQLENALERAVLMATGPLVDVGDLPRELRDGGASTAAVAPAPDGPHGDDGQLSVALRGPDDLSIKVHTAALEQQLIARAMERTAGNRTQAARLLEISYKTLVYKLRDYDLEHL